MTPAWLQPLLDWLITHPTWAGTLVFFVAMLESLLVVGVLVPGALMMLAFGALIAIGVLDLWSTLLWAIGGAIAGDSISYFIGWYFKQSLRGMWPFRKHPQILIRGEQFFMRHGGKSIVLGRFVGPVRAIIPTIAGILDMPPGRFFFVNIVSAIAWAPIYILPGVAIGSSLTLASQVAARLGILLLALLISIWLMFWSIRATFLYCQPRANRLLEKSITWGRNHPFTGRFISALLDPTRPETAALSGLAVILIFSSWLFAALLLNALSGLGLGGADRFIFNVLQNLRTPVADHLMVSISQLSDSIVTIPIALALLAWFAWQRHWLAVGHWIAAISFATVITALLKLLLHVPRPIDIYTGNSAFAFPSGHTLISTVMYGFLAVIIANEIRQSHRWLPYGAAAIFISAIAFSRLYLGAHWLSDVLGGLTLGVAWVAVLGLGYQRRRRQSLSVVKLIVVTSVILIVTGGWHLTQNHQHEFARYSHKTEQRILNTTQWWNQTWATLPAFRIDMGGDESQPLTIQWAGALTHLQNRLLQQGWSTPQRLSMTTALSWLTPDQKLTALPLLPQAHNGHFESLSLINYDSQNKTLLVLRLWRSDIKLGDADTIVWVGNVSFKQLNVLPFLAYSKTDTNFDDALNQFEPYIHTYTWQRKQRLMKPHKTPEDSVNWQSDVLLIRE